MTKPNELHAHLNLEALDERSVPARLTFLTFGRRAGEAIQVRPAEPEGQRITVTGTLQTGIFAIGGETTGTILTTADGRVYELDFGRRSPKSIQRYDGKRVTVTGTYVVKPGVEVPERHIIIVDTLRLARTGGRARLGA